MIHRLSPALVFLLVLPLIASAKPNVLFIAVDDLRPELGCYGSRAITPNIDRLAASGLRFDRAYCNQAVCGASRVSLMTGLYPEYTGERTFHVRDWRQRWGDVTTLNQHFKAHGYQTIGLGKIYHGSNGPGVDPENWTEWLTVDGREYALESSLEAKRNNWSKGSGRHWGPATEMPDVPDDSHFDGNRAEKGAALIRRLAKDDAPFFLAVGFTKPHLPFVAPKKLGDHSSWCKHTNFEVDTRVPRIIRHPGMESARGSTTALTELIDLYPTLTDLCGLPSPDHLQGQSLRPILENPDASHRDLAYSSSLR